MELSERAVGNRQSREKQMGTQCLCKIKDAHVGKRKENDELCMSETAENRCKSRGWKGTGGAAYKLKIEACDSVVFTPEWLCTSSRRSF